MPILREGGGNPVDIQSPRSQTWTPPNQATINVVDTTAAQTLTNKTFVPPVEVVTAANVLTAAESGTVYFLDLVGGFDTTLPAAAAGLTFTFIVKTAPTTAYTITAATADTIIGTVYSSTGGDADSEVTLGADVINFVASTAVIGDRVDITCDGSSWYAICHCNADGGVTLTG